MKISAFHLMPHRELPVDFEKRYESVWVTPPWWELADARRVGEYAMLDCISGGRLVAGLPLGSPMDVNLCYGVTPMEHRERYREAFALTLKAWQAREIFAWNGRYFQLANVNLWPRPIQQPHP